MLFKRKLTLCLFAINTCLLGAAAPPEMVRQEIPEKEVSVQAPILEKRVTASLGVMNTLEPWWDDRKEDPKERQDRFTQLTQAQWDVVDELTCTGSYANADDHQESDGPLCVVQFPGKKEHLVTMLMTAGFWESRFSRRIQAGDCKEGECDGGRARSVYQVQNNGTFPSELWENAEGLDWDSTRSATKASALTLSAAYRACAKTHRTNVVRAVFSAYARGTCTTNIHGVKRSSWYDRRLALLNKNLEE